MNQSKNELMNARDLADALCMSVNAVHNRLARQLPMPPSFLLPGGGKRLWRKCDVDQWIADAAAGAGKVGKKKAGRPTKREALAQQNNDAE